MYRSLAVPVAMTVTGVVLLAVVVASFTRPDPPTATYQVGSSPAASEPPAALDPLTVAIERAQSRLRDHPADHETWAGLGSAYVQKARITGDSSNYRKAEGALRRSLALHPAANWQAMTGLGALANARHNYTQALSWARTTVAVNPYDAGAYAVMDEALTQLGDYPAAAKAARTMLELEPGLPALARASYHFEERGEVVLARKALVRALKESTERSDVAFCRYYLGQLAFNEGDPRAALRQYQLGLDIDPTSDPLLAGRARAQVALGRKSAALHDYATVIARVPLPQYVLEYAELLQSLDRDTAADEQFALVSAEQKLLAANGVVDDLTPAVVEASHGSATAAVRHAEAEWGRRKSVIVADALGWALHRAGRNREALSYAKRANRLGWRNAAFRYHLGMIELSLGRRAKAHRDLATALEINPYFSVLQAPLARRALITSADAG
jgi:tetratricopeptide (TPR) repeat protein